MTPLRGKRDSDGRQVYFRRQRSRILAWTNYDAVDIVNYKRSMVLLFFPYEHIALLDHDKFLTLFEAHETDVLRKRHEYECYGDLERTVATNRELWTELSGEEARTTQVPQTETSVYETADLLQPQNSDIRNLGIPRSLTAVIKVRSNVLTSADY